MRTIFLWGINVDVSDYWQTICPVKYLLGITKCRRKCPWKLLNCTTNSTVAAMAKCYISIRRYNEFTSIHLIIIMFAFHVSENIQRVRLRSHVLLHRDEEIQLSRMQQL